MDAMLDKLRTARSLIAIWRAALLLYSEEETSISGSACSPLQVGMRDIAAILSPIAEAFGDLSVGDDFAMMYAHQHADAIESALWQQLSSEPLKSQPTGLQLLDLDRAAAHVQALIDKAMEAATQCETVETAEEVAA